MPANFALFVRDRKHRFASDCVVVDAARIEPFSRLIIEPIQWLAAKFPARRNTGIFESLTGNEQGISGAEQGMS